MNTPRKALLAGAMLASTLTGGAVGAALFASSGASAQTTTTTPAPAATAPANGGPGSGTFHSNEDATHEAGESAAREAQENAGQVPTVP
jgi:hypothetical protein